MDVPLNPKEIKEEVTQLIYSVINTKLDDRVSQVSKAIRIKKHIQKLKLISLHSIGIEYRIEQISRVKWL